MPDPSERSDESPVPLDRARTTPQRKKIAHQEPIDLYSFPRRFDLASMLAISTAYGVLFAAMRFYYAPAWFAFGTAGLFAVVALGQAILYRGENPRVASFQVGVVYCAAISLFATWGARDGGGVCAGLAFSLFFGAPLGYMAGACVGGIFLVADYMRRGSQAVRRKYRKWKAAS